MKNNEKKAFTTDEYLKISMACESASTIGSLLVGASEMVGVTLSCYLHFPAVGAFDFTNSGVFHSYDMPQFIVDYYSKGSNFFLEPIISTTLKTGRPVWLSECLIDPKMIELGHEKNIQIAMDAVGDGLCVPLFGPNKRSGFAFAAFGRGKDTFDPVMAYQMRGLLQTMHVRYCVLVKALQAPVKLTPREAEVLELIGYGKTNSEIATILGISTRTIDGHAGRVYMKLGTSDRVSAAMRAQTIEIDV